MASYYSFPFVYGNRMGPGAPQVSPAMQMPPVQAAPIMQMPMEPVMPAPMTPEMPLQMAPVQNAPVMPVQMPEMQVMPAPPAVNMQPMMPVCPFTGNPVMPISPYGMNGNMGMPVSPYSMNGNQGMTASPYGMNGTQSMPMAPYGTNGTQGMSPTAYGPLGNQGIPALTPGVANIPEMEDEDMEMDFGPATTDDRQPQPILSNNPATTRIVLFKELTAYPNYGNPSGNADILYTGNRGAWTFEVPAYLFVPGNLNAVIVIRGVLDDHGNVPVSRYSARITVNGSVVHTGPLPLVHGTPVGGRFTNWRELTFNVPNFRRSNRIVINNTSNTGDNDWIAFDWMELRLVPR